MDRRLAAQKLPQQAGRRSATKQLFLGGDLPLASPSSGREANKRMRACKP
jgi:hypothetical protein